MIPLKKKLTYPIKSCFKDRETLEKAIEGHHPQRDGTILLVGAADYRAFYSPKKDKIILTVYGKDKYELIEAEINFFEHIGFLYLKDK